MTHEHSHLFDESVEELLAKIRHAMRTSPTVPEMRAIEASTPTDHKAKVAAAIDLILATRQYLWMLVHVAEAQTRDHSEAAYKADGRLERLEKGVGEIRAVVDGRLDHLEKEVGEIKDLMLNLSTLIGASIQGQEHRNDNDNAATHPTRAPEPGDMGKPP